MELEAAKEQVKKTVLQDGTALYYVRMPTESGRQFLFLPETQVQPSERGYRIRLDPKRSYQVSDPSGKLERQSGSRLWKQMQEQKPQETLRSTHRPVMLPR